MTLTENSPAGAGDAKAWTYERAVVAVIAALVCVRLIVAANMPLASDETLYWRYSRYLAPGYLDHPAMNPFLIRLGTTMFGDTPFGIRLFAVLIGIPASWAVWRSAAILIGNERAGAVAALFFNLTVTLNVGSLLATSDASVVATSAFVLFFLSKLHETGRGVWWLAIGAAIGVGMWAKYTTAFFAFSIFFWLLAIASQRRWFFSPWPYAGAVLALAIFTPVLLWNVNHEWASVTYQSSRLVTQHFKIAFPLELIASQIGLATPPIFILAVLGAIWGRRDGALKSATTLFVALVAPVLIYFLWHSLHERVQGNWPECITPALVCLASLAVELLPRRSGQGASVARWSKRLAAPVALGLAALVYAQGLFAALPLGRRDPTSRLLGVGWPELARQIDSLREQADARVLLATDYTTVSVLTYYLPSHTPVEQINERVRWANEPPPPAALFDQPMLYVCKAPCRYLDGLPRRFVQVGLLGTRARMRGSAIVEQYSVYRVAGQRRPTLDPMYPIRTKASGPYVL
jgi:hypothetical protein